MILLLIYLFEIVQHHHREKKFKKSRKRCSQMGTKIVVTGDTGAGKTTLVAGISTFLEKHVMKLAKDKMEYIQIIMCKYDFRYFNFLIDTFSYFNYDIKTNELFDIILPAIEKVLYKGENHNYYYDGIKVKSYEELIKEYIEARVAINRKNYVWSNIEYISLVTGKKSYDLDPRAIQIKDRLADGRFDLRKYSILFYDEETMDPNKKNTQWQRVALEDTGAPEFYRVHRQLFKETSFYLGTAQHGNRIIKEQRELYNTVIHVSKRKRLSEYSIVKFIFKAGKWFNETVHKIKMKLIKNKDKALAKMNAYKKRQYFYMHKLDILNSNDFLSYTVDMYESTEDEANHSRERIGYKFIFPIKWCFSPINSWEFSYQYDELVENSIKSPKIRQLNAKESTRYYLSKKKKISAKEAEKPKKRNKYIEGGI